MTGTSTKLGFKRYEPKQFPDHLMRAPMDTSGPSSPKRPQSALPIKGGSGKKSLQQVKQAKELARKMESETKKIKRAEQHRKMFFAEIKKILDSKQDEESFIPPQIQAPVGQVR